MLGKPKFKRGEKVIFKMYGQDIEGTIEIIDAYGTWLDSTDVSYDILVKGYPYDCLYKHISERGVRKSDT